MNKNQQTQQQQQQQQQQQTINIDNKKNVKFFEENVTSDSSSFNSPSFWDDLTYKKQENNNYIIPPTCFSLQRFVLYETKTRFYLVGSNRTKNRFKVLKIDRTYEDQVVISEDPTDYNKQQIQDLLTMIGNANKEGLTRICSAYGILGFIRFLHGYYIILITKKRKVGMIGTHFIYGIDDITYVYIPPSFPKTNSPEFADETRYKGLFLSLDLTKDFYFSYTYDITRTLQFNMTRYFHSPIPKNIQRDEQSNKAKLYYNDQFTWNQFLLEHLVDQAKTWYWVLPIIHGFYVQDKIDIFGKGLDLVLIARRSRYYAGARFLKRGINENGHVANDVETEQILQEPLTGISSKAQFSSFVQIRGSIPLYWEQDNNIMTPKPPIKIQRVDPYFGSTILHFQDLFKRFGSPIIILNLVKSNEKKPRESILREEFTHCINTLNEMLPEQHKIHYQAWDFHQAAKSKDQDHMAWLDSFANQSILKTGIFYSNSKLYCNFLRENYSNTQSYDINDQSSNITSSSSSSSSQYSTFSSTPKNDTLFNYSNINIGTEQIGIVRTNCIDSLDRTNAAQFCIGKCALAYQLYSMGLLESPSLDFNTGIVQVLIDMYEACGNQIALQYGGSELANTIKTYTKHSLSSQSRDLVNAIKRYISNSFIDADKQHSINLFLGYFVPSKQYNENIPLWNLETDHYLHNITSREQHVLLADTNWWDEPLLQFQKSSLLYNLSLKSSMIEMMKAKSFYEFEDTFYKNDRLTLIEKHFSYRFNDPIRFRNQSSPLSITIENPSQNMRQTPYLQQKLIIDNQFPQFFQPTQSSSSSSTSFNNNNNNNSNISNNSIQPPLNQQLKQQNQQLDIQQQQQQQQQQQDQSTDLNSSIDDDDNKRYDIKRWVVSLSKRNNNSIFKKDDKKKSINNGATNNIGNTTPNIKNNSLKYFKKNYNNGNYQPLKHFGIHLGTSNFDLEIFEQYLSYTNEINPLENSSQDEYSIKFYKEYLNNEKPKNFINKPQPPQKRPQTLIDKLFESIPSSPPSQNNNNNNEILSFNNNNNSNNNNPLSVSLPASPHLNQNYKYQSDLHINNLNNNNGNNDNTSNYQNQQQQQQQRSIISSSMGFTSSSTTTTTTTTTTTSTISSSSPYSTQKKSNQSSNNYNHSSIHENTKNELKSYYYQSYLQSHSSNSLYQVPPNHIDSYKNYVNLPKSLNH